MYFCLPFGGKSKVELEGSKANLKKINGKKRKSNGVFFELKRFKSCLRFELKK